MTWPLVYIAFGLLSSVDAFVSLRTRHSLRTRDLALSVGDLPETRRVWRIAKPGSIGALRLEDEPLLYPNPGELTVQVEAVGLNFADVWTVLGLYKAANLIPGGVVPGLEFAGKVIAVGIGETTIPVGSTVFGFTRFGAFADHVTVPASFVRPCPSGWSAEEAAAFLVQGLTAWHALDVLGDLSARCARARAANDQPPVVLVHSTAGGVGLAAVQICKRLGAISIGTVGNQQKVSWLEDEGRSPNATIVRPSRGGAKALAASVAGAVERTVGASTPQEKGNPGCVDVVLDGIGGSCFEASLSLLNVGGRLVHFGGSEYSTPGDRPNWLHIAAKWLKRPRVDPGSLVSRSLGVVGFNLIFLTDRVAELNVQLDSLLEIRSGEKPPFVGRIFSFEDAPDALRFLQSGFSVGKVVLQIKKSGEVAFDPSD